MPRQKVLITVKTYPTLSLSYQEVVCTAGVREDGSWIRIYPVPFRRFDEYQQYHKYQWIEADLARNLSDRRSESFRLQSDITLLDRVTTANDWAERRRLIVENGTVYTNLSEIIGKNKKGELSLATFKPSRIRDVLVEDDERDWDPKKVEEMRSRAQQGSLFETEQPLSRLARKLPYKFRYEFEDDEGRVSRMMIEDWELGALYWKELDRLGDESKAVESVKKKFLEGIVENHDIHFFLGTTLEWDARGTNPFLIVGVFYPPESLQQSLL